MCVLEAFMKGKKSARSEVIYCPECEKLNKKTRLVRDQCPECHYQHLIIKG